MKLCGDSFASFKQFRKSTQFKPVAWEIADALKRVLERCARMDSGFELIEIDALIDEYAVGDSDFNDQILITMCKGQG